MLLLLFLTFSVLVANPKKTTLHDGQSRSWSAEQGKENKIKSLAAYPPPQPLTLLAFQCPAMLDARMSLWTQLVYSFSSPPRLLHTAPSRYPKTFRFGSRPPLIRRSVPAHKSLLVRNVVSMLSHRVISRARL